jgi:hypothetical protein
MESLQRIFGTNGDICGDNRTCLAERIVAHGTDGRPTIPASQLARGMGFNNGGTLAL